MENVQQSSAFLSTPGPSPEEVARTQVEIVTAVGFSAAAALETGLLAAFALTLVAAVELGVVCAAALFWLKAGPVSVSVTIAMVIILFLILYAMARSSSDLNVLIGKLR